MDGPIEWERLDDEELMAAVLPLAHQEPMPPGVAALIAALTHPEEPGPAEPRW